MIKYRTGTKVQHPEFGERAGQGDQVITMRRALLVGVILTCTGCSTGWGILEMRGSSPMAYTGQPGVGPLRGSYPTQEECQRALVADLDQAVKLFNPERIERINPNTVKTRPIAGPRAGGEEFLSYQCVQR